MHAWYPRPIATSPPNNLPPRIAAAVRVASVPPALRELARRAGPLRLQGRHHPGTAGPCASSSAPPIAGSTRPSTLGEAAPSCRARTRCSRSRRRAIADPSRDHPVHSRDHPRGARAGLGRRPRNRRRADPRTMLEHPRTLRRRWRCARGWSVGRPGDRLTTGRRPRRCFGGPPARPRLRLRRQRHRTLPAPDPRKSCPRRSSSPPSAPIAPAS